MVPAFASFILLSYTKFSLTSSMILTPTHLTSLAGGTIDQMYFFYAAQYSFSDAHKVLRYILPATIVCATVVAIPPLVMLDYPLRLFERVLRRSPLLWRLYPSVKIHIMLDAFQGCYRDRYRWFAGLYFVFRLLINVTNAAFDDLQQFFLQEFYCIVFALLVAFLRPYRRRYHLLNYFDSFIFFNLAVINLITFYLYANSRRGAKPSVYLFVLQYVLVFVPLVYMVGYVVWSTVPFPRMKEKVWEWLEARQNSEENENLIEDDQEETPDAQDEVDWTRAEAINRYKKRPASPPLHSSVPRPSGLHSSCDIDDQLIHVCANDDTPSSISSSTASSSFPTIGSSGGGSGKGYGSIGAKGTGVINSNSNTTSTSGMSTLFSTYSHSTVGCEQ